MTVPLERSLSWMEQGTALLVRAVDSLSDDELGAGSACPGWSRQHLLAHVGFNAQALRRLAAWARTGVRTPMYASPEQRADEIAEAAGWPAQRVRDLVVRTAGDLAADLHALSPEDWRAEVVTAQGRTVPATEIPWMRTREVAVHAVDLAAGIDFADLPEDLCDALVTDVAALRSRRADGPALDLRSATGGRWAVAGDGEPVTVEGRPQDLARWLTGRGGDGVRGPAGAPPVLPAWL